jgi:hypothetical protein
MTRHIRLYRAFHCVMYLTLAIPTTAVAQEQCDGADRYIAETSIPPDSAIGLRRHLAILQALPEHADVVLLGDSLVEAWPQDILDTMGREQSVLNMGVGRDRIQNVTWRLKSGQDRLKNLSPKDVVILVGTNNIYLDKSCGMEIAYNDLLDEIHLLWAKSKIIQIGILPRGIGFKAQEARRVEFNGYLSKMQKSKFVDADSVACADSSGCDRYQSDLLHLRRSGYELLENLLKPYL